MQAEAGLFIEASGAAILAHLHGLLSKENIRAFLVGGYVRDALLGKASRDIDIAVGGDPVSLARRTADALSGAFVLLDEQHQVSRVVLKNGESAWHLDFAPVRGEIDADLAQRDFTMNAIAAPLAEFEAGWQMADCIDSLGGMADLQNGLIRATGEDIFRQDPARLLRGFRFEAELRFVMESDTAALVARDSSLVADISGERIREELGRILESACTTATVRHMDASGLLDKLVPELAGCKGVAQQKEHYWNVFDHSIETVAAMEQLLTDLYTGGGLLARLNYCAELGSHFGQRVGNGMTRRALIKLAALLHDVAKPQTKRYDDEKQKMRFLGHARQGARLASDRLDRWRFSSREKAVAVRLIDQHLRPGHLSNAPQSPTRRAIYRYFRDNGDLGVDILFLSLADHLATRGPAFDSEAWSAHIEFTDTMLSHWFQPETVVSPPRLIDGHILMDRLGLAPGVEVGRLLELVREAHASGEITTPQEALDLARKELDKTHANQR